MCISMEQNSKISTKKGVLQYRLRCLNVTNPSVMEIKYPGNGERKIPLVRFGMNILSHLQ